MAGFNIYVLYGVISIIYGAEGSEILSRNKTTSQSSDYIPPNRESVAHTSDKAVDGNNRQTLDDSPDTCAHQNTNQKETWWRVDLQEKAAIEKVEIYYRDEGQNGWTGWKNRFAGYQIYLSNTTERQRICYNDTTASEDDVTSHVIHEECNGTAQYVILYNYRNDPERYNWYDPYALLELCEIQVYGCPEGRYGNTNCNMNCSPNCPGQLCHPGTGACQGDIMPGAKCRAGDAHSSGTPDLTFGVCEDCGANTYSTGSSCMPCPEVCVGPCGSSGGCTECIPGKYGPTCAVDCPNWCKDKVCDQTSGHCNECIPGKYGSTCAVDCPNWCKDKVCDQTSGHCNECIAGKYADFCYIDCPNTCKDQVCDRNNGNCNECTPGIYGSKCAYNCSSGCKDKVCDQISGHCDGCAVGKHGQMCHRVCPYTCMGGVCDQTTGNCDACDTGHYGSYCTPCSPNCSKNNCNFSGRCSECVDGKHGAKCDESCTENCTKCLQDGGQCSVCVGGYYGSSCSDLCGNCEVQICDKNTGSCSSTCLRDWTGDRCNVKATIPPTKPPAGGSNVGVYAGAGAGAAILILVVVVVIVVVVRKRKSSGSITEDAPLSEPTAVFRNTKSSNTRTPPTEASQGQVFINLTNEKKPETPEDQDNVYYNEGPMGFPVTKLKTIIARKMANEEEQFIQEFQALPLGAAHPHKHAEENKAKNRFKAIHPYDHSRVILDAVPGESGSDYINADYMDGAEEKKVYIATQGPLPSTIDDFWRMVWHLKSGKIVMLTNLIETQKIKCAKYWPDEGHPMTTTTYVIALKRERDYASHVVRNITLVHRQVVDFAGGILVAEDNTSLTKDTRDIKQFHFTTWPDHGTPNTLELVLFLRRVKLCKTLLPGQMIVHCSAGIGRTGTFIALDTLFDFGKKYDRIDIRYYVKIMRKDRMNMIQTLEQYIALHEILAEAFDLQDTLIQRTTFSSKYHSLSVTGQPSNQTQLRDEFKLMLELKPDYKLEQDFCASTLPDNKIKNRTMRVLAADRFRAFLNSYPAKSTDYINAVITQSYIATQGYIVTQFPLPGTRADLWTLVLDYHSDTLVVLGDEHETEQDSRWIPDDDEELSIQDFTLKQKGGKSEFSGVEVIDLIVSRKKSAHKARILRMKEWTDKNTVPNSKQGILHLLEQVESRRRASGNKPVVVMCKDGSTQCGLYCLMANTRDQIKMDEEVDIFQAARQLLIRRPEFLGSFDQYQFCYRILNDYLEATDVYIN